MSTDRLRSDTDPTHDDVAVDRRSGERSTLAWGLVGGLVATGVMTAYRLPIARSLPPSATFWAKFVGDGDPADYPVAGLLLHLAYGVGAGAAYAVVYDRLDRPRSSTPEGRATLWGLAYGVALSILGERVLLEWLLDRDLAPDERTVFHTSHAIYGLTLGTWVGSRGAESG